MLIMPMSNQQLIWMFRGALFFTVAVVSWLAFTGSKVQMASLVSDKINHFAAFFVLSFLLDCSFPQFRFAIIKVWPILAYGLLIEIVQSQLSYREFSLLDMLADTGALFIYWLIRKPMRKLIVAK